MVNVLDEGVLVEQTLVKANTVVFVPGEADNDDQWEATMKIIAIGPNVPESYGLSIDAAPIFTKHTLFDVVETIKIEDEEKVSHFVVQYRSIIALK